MAHQDQLTAALDVIKTADFGQSLANIAAVTNLPYKTRMVLQALSVLLGEKTDTVHRMLRDHAKFVQALEQCDNSRIHSDIVMRRLQPILSHEWFTPKEQGYVSSAAAGLCAWVVAKVAHATATAASAAAAAPSPAATPVPVRCASGGWVGECMRSLRSWPSPRPCIF